MTKSTKFARFALYLSLALVAWFAIAAFGPKFGLFSWKIGFGVMTAGYGIWLIGACALVAVVALVSTLIKAPRKGWVLALVALAIPAGFFLALAGVQQKAASVPLIHDVATDLADPPLFSDEVLALRQSVDANPITDFTTPLNQFAMWQNPRFSSVGTASAGELIAKAYPGLEPVALAAAPVDALAVVAAAMRSEGLQDVAVDEASGTVSGVAEIFLYGFKDDVVARVRPGKTGGSVVDFRSTSRVGVSDLGVNAQRVERLIADIRR